MRGTIVEFKKKRVKRSEEEWREWREWRVFRERREWKENNLDFDCYWFDRLYRWYFSNLTVFCGDTSDQCWIAGAIVSFEGESVRVCSCMLYLLCHSSGVCFCYVYILCCRKGTEVGLVWLMCVGVDVCSCYMSYIAWYWWSGSPEASSGRNGAPRRVDQWIRVVGL